MLRSFLCSSFPSIAVILVLLMVGMLAPVDVAVDVATAAAAQMIDVYQLDLHVGIVSFSPRTDDGGDHLSRYQCWRSRFLHHY